MTLWYTAAGAANPNSQRAFKAFDAKFNFPPPWILPQFLNCSTWNLSNVKNKFYHNNFQTNFVISLSWQSWSRLSKRQICRLCSICVPEKLFSIPQTQTLFLHILGTFWTSNLAFTSRGRKVNVQYIVVSATHSGKWTVFHSSRFFYFFYGKKQNQIQSKFSQKLWPGVSMLS